MRANVVRVMLSILPCTALEQAAQHVGGAVVEH
jgi:hypothetical protein